MIVVAALLGLSLGLQAPVQAQDPRTQTQTTSARAPIAAPTDSSASATRASTSPVIDAKDDDEIWRTAPPITAFHAVAADRGQGRASRPRRRWPTTRRIYMCSFARSIRTPTASSSCSSDATASRRPTWSGSSSIRITTERTGYEFGVNAAGVKMDQAIYDDGNEDGAWDAVWDVATRIDSLGWTAEFRIPLSQMRYGRDREHTFGVNDRSRHLPIQRARTSGPLLRQSKTGFVSQLGTLDGMDDLEAPRKLEAMPYVVTKNASQIVNNSCGSKVECGRRRRPQVSRCSERYARRHGQSRLRPGRIGSVGAQPLGLRDRSSTSGAPSSSRDEDCSVRRELQRGQLQRGESLL